MDAESLATTRARALFSACSCSFICFKVWICFSWWRFCRVKHGGDRQTDRETDRPRDKSRTDHMTFVCFGAACTEMQEEEWQGEGSTAGGAGVRLSAATGSLLKVGTGTAPGALSKRTSAGFSEWQSARGGGSGGATASGTRPITGPDVRTRRVLNPLLPEPSSAPDSRRLPFWVLLPQLSLTLKTRQGQ